MLRVSFGFLPKGPLTAYNFNFLYFAKNKKNHLFDNYFFFSQKQKERWIAGGWSDTII
jgi:hypothetical protein